MKLIVGLGNPDKKYAGTRHNVGFRVLDAWAKEQGVAFEFSKKFSADLARCQVNEEKIILCKPQTFMNNSGRSVRAVSSYHKIKPQHILVVHDDIDLPLGKIRLRYDGSSAGHNGVQSIIDHLGTPKFNRARVGVAGKYAHDNTADFVLENFTKSEEKIVKKIIALLAEKIPQIIMAAKIEHQDFELTT